MAGASGLPLADTFEARLVGQAEVLVVVEEPKSLEEGGEHGLGQTEAVEQPGLTAMDTEEVVDFGVVVEHLGLERWPSAVILVEDHAVAREHPRLAQGDQHVLDRPLPGIAAAQATDVEGVDDIAEDHQALLDHAPALELHQRQRRGPPRLGQQPLRTRDGDVDDLEVDRVVEARERE